MDKGRLEEAEALLQTALSLYPREALMDGDMDIDPDIKDSFETLFGNIRDRLETIAALKGGPRLGSPFVTSLRELVARNVAKKRETLAEEPLPEFTSFESEQGESSDHYYEDTEKEAAISEPETPAAAEHEKAPEHFEPLVEYSEEEFPDISEVAPEKEEFPDIEADFSEAVAGAVEKTTAAVKHVIEPEVEESASGRVEFEESAQSDAGALEEAIESALTIEEEKEPAAPSAELEEYQAGKQEEEEHSGERQPPVEPELSDEEVIRKVSDLADHIADSLRTTPKEQEDDFPAPPVDIQLEQPIEESPAPPPVVITEEPPAEEPPDAEAVAETHSEHDEESSAAQPEQSTEEEPTEAMPTEKQPGKQNPFKTVASKISSIFAKKKKENETPAAEPAAEPEILEQPAEAVELVVEPEPEEPAPEPEPANEEEEDEEALLSADEMKALKAKSQKKPIITVEATVDFSGVFGTIIIVIMFGVGIYLFAQNYLSTTAMDTAYKRTEEAAKQKITGMDELLAGAQTYKEFLSDSANVNDTMPFIVAGWGASLQNDKNGRADAAEMIWIFKKQGLKSELLDEEAAGSLMAAMNVRIETGRPEIACEQFSMAANLLAENSLPAAQRRLYGMRLAKIGYALSGKEAPKTPKDAKAAREVLVKMAAMKEYLPASENAVIQRKALGASAQAVLEGRTALKNGDLEQAKSLAAQALRLNPESRDAAELIKSMKEDVKK